MKKTSKAARSKRAQAPAGAAKAAPKLKSGWKPGRGRGNRRDLAKAIPASRPLTYAAPDGGAVSVRLNKFLADCGVASRRKCDELITKGLVTIDDEIVTELGVRVDPTAQKIEVGGNVLKPETQRLRYYLLNKPKGVVCTNEQREARPRAIDLITDRDKGRIYSVGRLDEESEGLLILTNDGAFAQAVAHPRHGVPKTYRVQVRGSVEGEALDKIRRGVYLSEGRTGRVRVYVERSTPKVSTLSITLYEGKNREVRRVFAAVGYAVTGLRRTQIGTVNDSRLKTGHWRPLASFEVRELLELSEANADDALEAADPRTSGARGAAERQEGKPQRAKPQRAKTQRAKTQRAKTQRAKTQGDAEPAAAEKRPRSRRPTRGRARDLAFGDGPTGATQPAYAAPPERRSSRARRTENVPGGWPSVIRSGSSAGALASGPGHADVWADSVSQAGARAQQRGHAADRGADRGGAGPARRASRKDVVQRRRGKLKQGKDKGAPTRLGARLGARRKS